MEFQNENPKGCSEESIRPPATSDSSPASKLTFIHNGKIAVKFEGICLRQNITTFTHRNVVNLFIVNELGTWSRDLSNDFTLGGCMCGAIKLNKNVDPDKYGYGGYGIGFDAWS